MTLGAIGEVETPPALGLRRGEDAIPHALGRCLTVDDLLAADKANTTKHIRKITVARFTSIRMTSE